MITQKIKMSELRNLVKEVISEEKKNIGNSLNESVKSKSDKESKKIKLDEFKTIIKNIIKEEREK